MGALPQNGAVASAMQKQGSMHLSRAADLARCWLQNGAVVSVSSLSAIQINLESPSYNICKAAQDHLTKTLAKKYTGQGVRINSVNPGYVRAWPFPLLITKCMRAFCKATRQLAEGRRSFAALAVPTVCAVVWTSSTAEQAHASLWCMFRWMHEVWPGRGSSAAHALWGRRLRRLLATCIAGGHGGL
jgi:NAD(P)-dependent dehydrogenase (short-subunit alcohol dehydrogenase family)